MQKWTFSNCLVSCHIVCTVCLCLWFPVKSETSNKCPITDCCSNVNVNWRHLPKLVALSTSASLFYFCQLSASLFPSVIQYNIHVMSLSQSVSQLGSARPSFLTASAVLRYKSSSEAWPKLVTTKNWCASTVATTTATTTTATANGNNKTKGASSCLMTVTQRQGWKNWWVRGCRNERNRSTVLFAAATDMNIANVCSKLGHYFEVTVREMYGKK